MVRLVRAVRVVKQWFTSRTSGELHIISETWGVLQVVRLVRVVKQWFTSRTSGELNIISGTWGVLQVVRLVRVVRVVKQWFYESYSW